MLERTLLPKRPALNCWEFKGCGREEGGRNAHERGICPAYTQGAGDAFIYFQF